MRSWASELLEDRARSRCRLLRLFVGRGGDLSSRSIPISFAGFLPRPVVRVVGAGPQAGEELMAGTNFLSSTPPGLRRHRRRQLHLAGGQAGDARSGGEAAIHLAAGIFWTTAAHTARAGYWGLSSLEVLPRWGSDYSAWLDVGCNLVFAYGCWRAHQAMFLLLPVDRRGRLRRCLAWTLVPDAPRPVRRLLSRLGRALRGVTGWGRPA